MFSQKRIIGVLGAVLLALTGQARATLILDTSITGTFSPSATSTTTAGNDLPLPRPSTLYFGQLGATEDGFVDFFYVGNEAAYTNTLWFNDALRLTTDGRPDNFNAPHPLIGSMAVTAGSLLGFGMCTSGGDSIGDSGRCVWNNRDESLTEQYNYQNVGGYRSIGYAALSAYDPSNGNRTFSNPLNPGTSDSWMIFWDDSGARNDDNHDDLIVAAQFRPLPPTTQVTEPGTLALFGLGLFGITLASRRMRTISTGG